MMDYTQMRFIISRLKTAHDPEIAKIRGAFFVEEFAFFQKHIFDSRVLIAGSGLGHDAFALASNNKEVVGVELFPEVMEHAEQERQRLELTNVRFVQGNINDLRGLGRFDVAILNMGTISDFEPMAKRQKIIKELLKHARVLYLDFYPPTSTGMDIRKTMYEEEGWVKVRIDGSTIVSDDGLYSLSLTREEFISVAESIGAEVLFHPLGKFAEMAGFCKR